MRIDGIINSAIKYQDISSLNLVASARKLRLQIDLSTGPWEQKRTFYKLSKKTKLFSASWHRIQIWTLWKRWPGILILIGVTGLFYFSGCLFSRSAATASFIQISFLNYWIVLYWKWQATKKDNHVDRSLKENKKSRSQNGRLCWWSYTERKWTAHEITITIVGRDCSLYIKEAVHFLDDNYFSLCLIKV